MERRNAVLKTPAGRSPFPGHFVHTFSPGNFQGVEGHLLLILNPPSLEPPATHPLSPSCCRLQHFCGMLCELVALIIALEKSMHISRPLCERVLCGRSLCVSPHITAVPGHFPSLPDTEWQSWEGPYSRIMGGSCWVEGGSQGEGQHWTSDHGIGSPDLSILMFSLLLTPSQGLCIFNEGPTTLGPSESGITLSL